MKAYVAECDCGALSERRSTRARAMRALKRHILSASTNRPIAAHQVSALHALVPPAGRRHALHTV